MLYSVRTVVHHGLTHYIDIKAKCHHLKKFTSKGISARCLSEFIDWRYSQSCWYFRPSFVNCFPSNLLSGSTLSPLPLPCVKVQYMQIMCSRDWVGMLEYCWRPYYSGVYYTLYLTSFRTYKIARPPPNKTQTKG